MGASNNEPSTSGIITTTSNARQLSDGNPIGTTLGQGPTDLISFYNETPVAQFVQPASPDVTLGNAGSTTEVFRSTTFPGASGSSDYSIGDIVTALKALGILAA